MHLMLSSRQSGRHRRCGPALDGLHQSRTQLAGADHCVDRANFHRPLDAVDGVELRSDLAQLRASVRSEKLSEVAAEFDAIHSIERAVKVGSVDAVISARELRPRLVEAVERGSAHTVAARLP